MRRFKYSYLELFSYMGFTPEDPGGDFGISFWIDAPTAAEAERWGKVALAAYVRLRYRFATDPPDPASLQGQLDEDAVCSEATNGTEMVCKVGELATWEDPWADYLKANKRS